MSPAPKRRWFRYAILAVAVVAVGAFAVLGFRFAELGRARYECDRLFAAWQSGLATAADACQASHRRLLAETAIPFADRNSSAGAHLERIERIWLITYGSNSEWRMGVKDEAGLAEAEARKAEVERYYQEAKQLAGENGGP